MTSDFLYDAVVIGGGPAGASAAFHLARGGRSTLVLEKENSAHHKVCGEFLSPETLTYLLAMGVDAGALGASPVTGVRLCTGTGESRVALPARAMGLSRYAMDEACLVRAEEAGARVSRGTFATDFRRDGAAFAVDTGEGTFLSRSVFVATGKHEMKSVPARRGPNGKAIGFKMHLKPSDEAVRRLGDDVMLGFFNGGYAGLCRIENGIVNFCFMVEKDALRAYGNRYEDCVAALCGHRGISEILSDANPLWSRPLSVAPLPYGYVRPYRRDKRSAEGIFCVGDQFAVIPSLAGSGMAIALYTGARAAGHFLERGAAGVASYEAECARVIASRMAVAYPLHRLCRSPRLVGAAVRLLKPMPFVTRKLIELTRMPEFIPPCPGFFHGKDNEF